MNSALLRLIDVMNGPLSNMAARSALNKFATECGYKYFTYINLRDPENSLITNYPQEWRQLYFAKNFLQIDPVVTSAKRGSFVLNWGMAKTTTGITRDIADFYGDAAQFGIRSGFAITIPTGFGYQALLSLASDHFNADGIAPPHAQLAIVATTMIHKAVDTASNTLITEVKLTPREATCLRWIAEGKSSQEIADILDIRYNSVRFYLEEAKKKLAANSTIQAVAIASRLRLI